ncbi:MAG: BrnT family toxin [Elusimicrobiota bacterium]
MDFEYDPKKSASNQHRRGIDFIEAQRLWKAHHAIVPADMVRGEVRQAILGKIEGELYLAIYTLREHRIRLISCHRADGKWEDIYEISIDQKGEKKDYRG